MRLLPQDKNQSCKVLMKEKIIIQNSSQFPVHLLILITLKNSPQSY